MTTDRSYKPEGKKFGIRVGFDKFMQAGDDGSDELYDLKADPDELTNRVAEDSETRDELAEVLDAWLEDTDPVNPKVKRDLSPEDKETLEALGYFQ